LVELTAQLDHAYRGTEGSTRLAFVRSNVDDAGALDAVAKEAVAAAGGRQGVLAVPVRDSTTAPSEAAEHQTNFWPVMRRRLRPSMHLRRHGA
jgi:hypothetical protein